VGERQWLLGGHKYVKSYTCTIVVRLQWFKLFTDLVCADWGRRIPCSAERSVISRCFSRFGAISCDYGKLVGFPGNWATTDSRKSSQTQAKFWSSEFMSTFISGLGDVIITLNGETISTSLIARRARGPGHTSNLKNLARVPDVVSDDRTIEWTIQLVCHSKCNGSMCTVGMLGFILFLESGSTKKEKAVKQRQASRALAQGVFKHCLESMRFSNCKYF
jgi:hypothetical protein